MAQFRQPTLDSDSGHDFGVPGLSPASGSVLSREATVCLSSVPPPAHSRSLSKMDLKGGKKELRKQLSPDDIIEDLDPAKLEAN